MFNTERGRPTNNNLAAFVDGIVNSLNSDSNDKNINMLNIAKTVVISRPDNLFLNTICKIKRTASSAEKG